MLCERPRTLLLRSDGRRRRLVIVVLATLLVCQSKAVHADPSAEEMAARRARIEGMSAEKKDRLLRQHNRFASLSRQEQTRLRTLHQHVERDLQRDELRRVMQKYYEWLKALSPSQRAEITSLSPDERLARIEQIQRRRQRWNERRLSPEDLQAIADWLQGQLLSGPPDQRREWLARRLEGSKGPGQWMILTSSLRYSGNRRPRPSPESFEQLARALSPDARKKIQQADRRTRHRLVWFWIGQLSDQADRQLREPLRQVDDEELAKVFERLPEWERERLLDLPPDQIQRELRLRHFRSRTGGPRGRRGERPGEHPLPRDSRRRRPSPDGFRRGPPPERPPLH